MRRILGVLVCLVLLAGTSGFTSLQPIKVIKCAAHAGCGSMLLTWTHVDKAAGYDIYRMDEGQSMFAKHVQLNAEKNFYRDTKNAISGKRIKYYISAIDEESNEIAKSPEMMVIPDCFDETLCFLRLKFQVGNFMYWVNEKMDGPMDAAPEQTNGRVFLVIKYITKALGAKLEWLASEKKVTITTASGKVIELWIGKNKARINGAESPIDEKNQKVAPYLSNGRTMLPMRFVGDNLGATGINWDDPTKTASITIPVDCNEPDCYNLTVDSFNENIVTGTNQSGFKIKFDKSVIASGTVEIGQLVRVCGSFEIREDGVWINSRAWKNIDLTKTEFARGYVESVDWAKREISIKGCSGSIETYVFSPESGAGSVIKPLAINLSIVDKRVVSWRYIEMERICDKEELETIDLNIVSINCDEGHFTGEIIGKLPPEQVRLQMPSKEWCQVKTGSCLRIGFFRDGLSQKVAATMKELACPCDFEIITGRSEIGATTGSTFSMNFKVKNTGMYEGDFEPFMTTEGFPGFVTFSPERRTIAPEKVEYFTLSGKISEDFEGIFDFAIGVKCREASNSKNLKLNVMKPDFQVSSASGTTNVPTDENVNLNFDVTNYSEGPITVEAMVESSDFPGKLTVEPLSKEVPEKNSRTFTILGQWNKGAKVGATFNIRYSASCGKVTKTGKATVTSEAPGPIITLVDGKGDAKGLTLLDGSVNWKHYTKSRLEVDWGDGMKEDVKNIPAIHTYKKKGEYKVKVTAYTKEGVNSTATCSCFWEGPRPIIILEGGDWTQPNLTIKGKVDWNTLSPGKILVDWADGTKETRSGFPLVHRYNSVGIYLILITAVANTGEEGDALFLFLLMPGLNMPPAWTMTGQASVH